MAIYIKGIEMPKENEYVYLLIKDDKTVECVKSIFHINEPTTLIEMEQTTAIEVPKPHGRLIDADACIDDIRNNNQQAWEALAYAPIVIEGSNNE